MKKAMITASIETIIAVVFLIIAVSVFSVWTFEKMKVEAPKEEKKEGCKIDDDCIGNSDGSKCITAKEPYFCGCYSANVSCGVGYVCKEPEQKCSK